MNGISGNQNQLWTNSPTTQPAPQSSGMPASTSMNGMQVSGMPSAAPGMLAPMGMDMNSMLAPFNGEAGMPPASGPESMLTNLINQVIAPVIQVLTQLIQTLAAQLGLAGQGQEVTGGQTQAPSAGQPPASQQPTDGSAPAAPGSAGGSAPGTSAPGASAPGSAAPSAPSSPEGSKPGDTKPSPEGKFFQYKPFSDKDKNIAVLLPSKFTGESARVEILLPNGEKMLIRGKYSGTDKASGREVFRFDKQGSDIPDGSTVRITMQNGKTRDIRIEETSEGLKRALK